MTLGQLAAAEQVKPPTMTRIVTGLERSGLAERIPDLRDARRVSIRATPKGTRLLQEARQRRIQSLARQLALLTEKELASLTEAVETLQRRLAQWI
jgi:DNA-binding MarR family transcriptional regulator